MEGGARRAVGYSPGMCARSRSLRLSQRRARADRQTEDSCARAAPRQVWKCKEEAGGKSCWSGGMMAVSKEKGQLW